MEWHTLRLKEVVQQLGSDPNRGLEDAEAKRRLEKFGLNQLKEERKSLVRVLLEPFTEPMMLLLIVTGVLYSFLGEPRDAIAIFVIIAIIGLVEVIQEQRTETSIRALRKLTTLLAKVIRDYREKRVLSTEIVPGDLIVFETGDKVPADARLVEPVNLRVEESALTGESMAVEKEAAIIVEGKAGVGDRKNMVFAGTTVVHGKGSAIVVATGMKTEMGKIAGLMQTVKEKPTPLQEKMKQLTGWFVLISLSLCAVVVAVGVLQGERLVQMILFGLSLAVATIPEDLPIILAVILVLGVRRMAKHNALMKKSYAVETLGSTTVICADKTGTLTQNKMTVVSVYADGKVMSLNENSRSGISQSMDMALKIGILCNDARIEQDNAGRIEIKGDPMEKALLIAAYEAGIDAKEVRAEHKLHAELSFDSERKLMSIVYYAPEKQLQVFTKGAPEALLSKCSYFFHNNEATPLDKRGKEKILKVNMEMASNGLRVIGVAFKFLDANAPSFEAEGIEQNLVFIALISMMDPPREEVKAAIAECHRAGIRIVMITGDHKLTAVAISKELQLNKNEIVLTGQELNEMSEGELEKAAKDVDIYARVSPEHKLRIVHALRKSNEVVAMTGDGINDAPALKEADIGIAMGGTGTDVARDASAMVLADDNFKTIVEAVKEGRRIFDNLKKAIICYTSSKIAVLGTALAIVLFGFPFPFLPIQIILMEVLTDIIISTAFESETPEADLMMRPPRKRSEFVLPKKQQLRIFIQGLAIIMGVLFIYSFMLYNGSSLEKARTATFSTTLFSLVFLAFNSRSETRSLFRLGLFSNRNMATFGFAALMIGVLSIQFPLLQPFFRTVALTPLDWVIIFAISIMATFWIEINKILGKKGSR